MVSRFFIVVFLALSSITGQVIDLKGVVRDTSGTGMEGVEIVLTGLGLSTTSDSEGAFRILGSTTALDPGLPQDAFRPSYRPGHGFTFHHPMNGYVEFCVLDVMGREKARRSWKLGEGNWLVPIGNLETGVYVGALGMRTGLQVYRFTVLKPETEHSGIPILLGGVTTARSKRAVSSALDSLIASKAGYLIAAMEIQSYVDSTIPITMMPSPAPLNSPRFMNPSDTSVGIPKSLGLIWNSVSGATSYRIQVSADSTFASVLLDSTTVSGNAVVSNLDIGNRYFWRVRAFNATEIGPWSAGWSFTVGPPLAPILFHPPDGALAVFAPHFLHWSSATNVTSHRLQVSEDSTFSSAIIDSIMTTTSETITGLAPGKRYFWRVNSTHTAGTGAWSQVRRFTMSMNTLTRVDVAGRVGQWPSIVIPSDGLPVISYYDYSNGPEGGLKVVKCGNTACSENNTIATPTPAQGMSDRSSIALPEDGLPVISYFDGTDLDLKMVKCGNATCTSGNSIAVLDTAGDVGGGNRIAIGADGLPIISYLDATRGFVKVVKCGNSACTSGNTKTIVDSSGTNWTIHIPILVPSDGMPVMSFHGVALKVVKCGNSSCSSGNTASGLDVDAGEYSSIGISSDGYPVISHFNVPNHKLMVVKCGDAACSSGNTITSVDNGGRFSSLAVPADGLPVISYQDSANQNLKVVKCGNPYCSADNIINTVHASEGVGMGTFMAISSDGLPLIGYYDSLSEDLLVMKCGRPDCVP